MLKRGPPLSEAVRANFPPSFDFQTNGFRVAGSPIGSDAFMSHFVAGKVNEARSKVASIKLVGAKSPRAAHRLLIEINELSLCYSSPAHHGSRVACV